MLTLARRRGIARRLVEPGKPHHSVYIEFFDGRLCDECLNKHWLSGLLHTRAEFRAWIRDYNE